MAFDLTMSGASYAAAKFGNGLSAGSGSVAGVLPASGTFTITAWAYHTSPGLKIVAGQVNAFWMGMDASGYAIANVGAGGSAYSLTSTTPLDNSTEHHMELTIGASGGQLFVDGVSVATSATSDSSAGVDRTANPFEVAIFSGGFAWNTTGHVDEVAVWSAALHASGFTPPASAWVGNEANLVALWHLDSNGLDSKTSGGGGLAMPPRRAFPMSILNH